jgi:hypothetical protein
LIKKTTNFVGLVLLPVNDMNIGGAFIESLFGSRRAPTME